MNEHQDIFSTFLQAEALAFVLTTARIAGCMVVTPLPWVYAPLRVRAGLTLAIAFVVQGANRAPMAILDDAPLALAAAAFSELLLGAAIGFVVRLVVAVAEVLAGAVSPTIGLAAAEIFNPGSGHETSLGRFYQLFTLWLMLAVGVHRQLLGALLSSYLLLPVGTLVAPSAATEVLLRLTTTSIETGVRLAIPILAVLFMIYLALGFVSRAAPSMQVFSVGFALTILAGLGLVLVLLPELAQDLLAAMSHVPNDLEQLLRSYLR